tara:strand:- start:5277 stop:5393 length:117 start_codon:yes stop_codon:yes gene_type:complete
LASSSFWLIGAVHPTEAGLIEWKEKYKEAWEGVLDLYE